MIHFGRFMKNILQLVLSPKNGWQDVALDDEEGEEPVAPAFYLLIALVSLSWIVSGVYHPEAGWLRVMEMVVITYGILFVSYFVGTFVMSVSLESLVTRGEVNERRTRIFVMFGVAMLAIILFIANMLPAPTPVLWFLPVYVVVVLWKGARYLGVSAKRSGLFTLVSFLAVMLPPMLLGWLFMKVIL